MAWAYCAKVRGAMMAGKVAGEGRKGLVEGGQRTVEGRPGQGVKQVGVPGRHLGLQEREILAPPPDPGAIKSGWKHP